MVKEGSINTGEFQFKYHYLGNEQDELVLFLHGFPESSYMWLRLMEEIAPRGYFCVAPDLRGYSPAARPAGTEQYHLRHLKNDVRQIADALEKERFHLVGHDWGAFIGWSTAFHHAGQILSWTALSVPHPAAFAKAIKENKEQRKKSSYIKWFMIPYLSEWLIRRNNFWSFRKLWRRSSPEEQAYNLAIFKDKGALTAALNYYRANLGKGKSEKLGDIKVPTLFIWGKHDLAVSTYAAERNEVYMKGPYQFLSLDSGHWLIQSSFEEIRSALLNHLSLASD